MNQKAENQRQGAVATFNTPTRRHFDIWSRKPVIREIYSDYINRISQWRRKPGLTLEIGSGSGGAKGAFGDNISLDIQKLPWLDVVADAHFLPFSDNSFANIVLIDTLHHLESPHTFLTETARVLEAGGRLVMVEPAITPISWLVYNFLHPEPVILSSRALDQHVVRGNRDPFDANQAVPTTLFWRDIAEFRRTFPEFRILHREKFAILSYLLSGGFRRWSLLPFRVAKKFLQIERVLDRWLAPGMAFRLLVVLEKLG